MFDIGFWELCLVGLISLLVIGPERLPKAARIAGFWVGKARNMVTSVKHEINQELHAEEMRQIMAEQHAEMQTMLDDTAKITELATDEIMSLDKKPATPSKNSE